MGDEVGIRADFEAAIPFQGDPHIQSGTTGGKVRKLSRIVPRNLGDKEALFSTFLRFFAISKNKNSKVPVIKTTVYIFLTIR